ncbi:MAG: hypothetical protein EZS28_012488 [Streblomastix strix]|uniref:Protein kinase domain-containing protein n=1 Tax=Streblomastix strix TaxID=222440 RepID=A0A5J4WBP8_9EUKA|nr:MAG: hypothetical protein EZS28_012488 [Streblomastix strix]
MIDYEDNLRMERFAPIRPLGKGSFGGVYLAHHVQDGIVAIKIIQKNKFEEREWDAGIELLNKQKQCPFILKYQQFDYNRDNFIIVSDYSNMKTLDIIAKNPQINLPSFTLRALMKQILEGMRAFHSVGLIHRDIKCDNILLHSPPGSGLVYVKISDFGFAKKEDLNSEQTYTAGTLPFMAPELFLKPILSTQKVDIKMTKSLYIKRPVEITDNLLWNLLSKLLEFNSDRRITAAEALQYPYFTSPEAIADISPEQHDLAQQSALSEEQGDSNISEFDKQPSYIVAESVIKISKFPPIKRSNQASLSYTATEEQLQIEQNFIDPKLSLDEIRQKYLIFKSLSLQQRDIVSLNLYRRIEESSDNRENVIQMGIIDLLIQQLNTIAVEEIYLITCDPLVVLLKLSEFEQKQLLIKKGALSWTLRALQSENEDVLDCALYNIHKIMAAFLENQEEGKENILRQQLESDGTLGRILWALFNDRYKFDFIKYNAILAIACIYKAVPIPSKFGFQIIDNLKGNIKGKINHLIRYSSISLAFIAECRENHSEILKGDFLKAINNLFYEKWTEEYYPNIFLLLGKLYKFGDDETKLMIKNEINIDNIEEFKQHQNRLIVSESKKFLEMIDFNQINDEYKEKQKENSKEQKIELDQEQQTEE